MNIKVVAISDLHGHLPAHLPDYDLLLIAGDICPVTNHKVSFQFDWLVQTFRPWLEAQLAEKRGREIVGIAGNHDFVFEVVVPKTLPWTYLQDDSTELFGYKIYGTPWNKTRSMEWAFQRYEYSMANIWAAIEDDTDILVTHTPPQGFGDKVTQRLTDENEEKWQEPEHLGSPSLRHRLVELSNLKLHVYGHIHSGHGEYRLNGMQGPILANVSLLDEAYEAVYKPSTFALEKVHELV